MGGELREGKRAGQGRPELGDGLHKSSCRGAHYAVLLVAVLAVGSCGGSGTAGRPALPEPPAVAPFDAVVADSSLADRAAPATTVAHFIEVGETIPPDPEIAVLLAPYRDSMEAVLAEVVGHANGPFEKAEPEGTLENLVADAVLHVARELAQDTVHVAMLNDGGLRVPLAPGPLLVRHAFELLPFRNFVVVLTLTGEQMERLADQIATTRGEPVAGWTMTLMDGEAVDVRIDGKPIDPAADYRLVTVDYLANGGDSWSVLWEPGDDQREYLTTPGRPGEPDSSGERLLIRDAFIRYMRQVEEVTPKLDRRIRMDDRTPINSDSRP